MQCSNGFDWPVRPGRPQLFFPWCHKIVEGISCRPRPSRYRFRCARIEHQVAQQALQLWRRSADLWAREQASQPPAPVWGMSSAPRHERATKPGVGFVTSAQSLSCMVEIVERSVYDLWSLRLRHEKCKRGELRRDDETAGFAEADL